MALMIRNLRFAAFLLVFLAGSAQAVPQQGEVRLESGASLTWSLSDYTATPALGIALPATIGWSAAGLDLPIKIDLSTNYAAYIERWELSLYRESDSNRRHPIRQWRRPAAAFDAGVVWKGEVEAGPPLRPGEIIVALLRVRDVAGNIDEAQPQTMLVSRYLMPAQQRKYAKITSARRNSVAAGDPPAKQTIPVRGHMLDVWIDGATEPTSMHLAGLAMDDTGAGGWHLSQILPAGSYTLKAQTERPILGGVRLVSVGRFDVTVPTGEGLLATVKGTGDLARDTLATEVAGLKRDGLISGRDAVRLTLWSSEDALGRYAIARANPKKTAGLYRDKRNRSIVKLPPLAREIPWGGKQDPRTPSKPVKMRAHYPVSEQSTLILPHTDVSADKFFVSLRAPNAPPTYLLADQHFELEPLQGQVLFTQAGQKMIEQYQAAADGEATLDVAYLVRPSIAGMVTHRPEGERFVFSDNGASTAQLYGRGLPDEAQSVESADASGMGWFKQTFGWLMAD